MKVLADETGGKSYKAYKYGLDHVERPAIDYGENNIIWRKAGETTKHHTYVSLEKKVSKWQRSVSSILHIF